MALLLRLLSPMNIKISISSPLCVRLGLLRMRDDCPQLKLSRESVLGAWDAIETVEPIHGHLSMFFRASCRATSGVAPPFVAISKAAPIEVQNLPICGMFGITTPFSAFS